MAATATYATPPLPEGAQLYDLTTVVNTATPKSFIAATAAYMSALVTTLSTQTFQMMQNTKTEGDMLDSYTTQAEGVSQAIISEQQQIADDTPSGLFGEIIGYLMDAVMVVDGVISADPVEIMMGVGSATLQASGAQAKLAAAIGTGGNILAPLILSAAEAGVFNGTALAYGALKGEEATLMQAATTFTSTLSQGLLINNFWGNAVQSMGINDAVGQALLSLTLGIATCSIAGFAASYAAKSAAQAAQAAAQNLGQVAAEDPQSFLQSFKSYLIQKFPQTGEQMFHYTMLALKTIKYSMMGGIAVTQMYEGQQMKEAAAVTKEYAGTQKTYVTLQGLADLANSSIGVTQSAEGATNQNLTAAMQTFSLLAQMFAPPKNS